MQTHSILLVIMVPQGRLDRIRTERKGKGRSLEGTGVTIYDPVSYDSLGGVESRCLFLHSSLTGMKNRLPLRLRLHRIENNARFTSRNNLATMTVISLNRSQSVCGVSRPRGAVTVR